MKVLTILSAFFFLVVNTGFSINLHYCGGKINSVKLSSKGVGCCCAIKSKVSCCGDKVITVKYDNNVFSAISLPKIEAPSVVQLFFTNEALSFQAKLDESQFDLINWQLPPPHNQPLYIRQCRLTYYG